MEAPAFRPKLWVGIWNGFAVVIGFGLLAVLSAYFDLTPWRWAFLYLIGGKLVTNSLAWLGLTMDRFVMPTQILNTTADVLLLTAGIYFTGGSYSPLLPAYVIM